MHVLIPFLGISILCLWSLHSYVLLRHVPGPWAAAWTNLLRMSWILSDRAHEIHIDLHQKYGKLVRFGPNMVSVGDPAEIQTIYNFTVKFAKVKKQCPFSKLPWMMQEFLMSPCSLTSIKCSSFMQKANPYLRYLQLRMKICIVCSRNPLHPSTL